MPNLFKTSILLASLLAASALTIPGARAEPMNGPLMGSTPPHHHSLDSELQRRFLKYQITAPPVTGPSPGIHLDFESLGRISWSPGRQIGATAVIRFPFVTPHLKWPRRATRV